MSIGLILAALAIVAVVLVVRARKRKTREQSEMFYVCRQCEHPYFLPNVPARCRRCDGPVDKRSSFE